MTENDRKVLDCLLSVGGGDFSYLSFAPICNETKLDRRVVRNSCRRLARKGLATFGTGLWTEDGEPAGSGYQITPQGVAALQAAE